MPLVFFSRGVPVCSVPCRRKKKPAVFDLFGVGWVICILCGSRRRRRGVAVVSDDRACTCPVLRARAYTAYTARRGSHRQRCTGEGRATWANCPRPRGTVLAKAN